PLLILARIRPVPELVLVRSAVNCLQERLLSLPSLIENGIRCRCGSPSAVSSGPSLRAARSRTSRSPHADASSPSLPPSFSDHRTRCFITTEKISRLLSPVLCYHAGRVPTINIVLVNVVRGGHDAAPCGESMKAVAREKEDGQKG
ncbi:unnamed protein product, partial [Ectocarpus sp. 12 AP-2014]